MQKQQVIYTSPLDALIAVTKRLSLYENQYSMDTEEFFNHYSKGQFSDEEHWVEWANDYRHFLVLRLELENSLLG